MSLFCRQDLPDHHPFFLCIDLIKKTDYLLGNVEPAYDYPAFKTWVSLSALLFEERIFFKPFQAVLLSGVSFAAGD